MKRNITITKETSPVCIDGNMVDGGYSVQMREYNETDLALIHSIPVDCRIYDADLKKWYVTSPAAAALFCVEYATAITIFGRDTMQDAALKTAALESVKSGDRKQTDYHFAI